ncbi:SDR family oxidoreductase [Paenibacillus chartarius]|uniref:SDR family oxidoreductase n=1 Tax=Paenibacillus chartarius TaxID=747481 RepID=A0ABV6DLS7_9BACL
MIDCGRHVRGKTIVITGASKGIGKQTAELLSGLGANLVLGARDGEELSRFASTLKSEVYPVPVDVSEERAVNQFAEAAITRFGNVYALINCAGTGVFDSVLSLAAEDFDRMIAVNLRGTFLCCKAFGRHMAERGEGRMINVVSIAGATALPGCGGYSASKFGVLGLSRVLQAELRGKGIQVTAVLPGAVATPFWDRMDSKPDMSQMIPVQTLARHLIYILCQPEGASIDEITIMPPLGIL